jgi:hypothetical protein
MLAYRRYTRISTSHTRRLDVKIYRTSSLARAPIHLGYGGHASQLIVVMAQPQPTRYAPRSKAFSPCHGSDARGPGHRHPSPVGTRISSATRRLQIASPPIPALHFRKSRETLQTRLRAAEFVDDRYFAGVSRMAARCIRSTASPNSSSVGMRWSRNFTPIMRWARLTP